jgi:transcriptional regulator with XRE-family HTH domain
MTPAEFKSIRKSLGLSTVAMGRALGYGGNDNTVSVQIRQYESGGRVIPPWIARLVAMYGRHGLLDVA